MANEQNSAKSIPSNTNLMSEVPEPDSEEIIDAINGGGMSASLAHYQESLAHLHEEEASEIKEISSYRSIVVNWVLLTGMLYYLVLMIILITLFQSGPFFSLKNLKIP